jgi:hypothetical protein
MNAIRVRKKIDSDTLHIPELRSMIGRDVEIIVLEDQPAATPSPLDRVDPHAFWKGKTVDQLAAEQGVPPFDMLKSLASSPFTAEDFEGFDETLEAWRRGGR